MSKQPEALRLADESDNDEWIAGTNQWRDEAAAELRRLHEVNQELLEALKKMLDDSHPAYVTNHYMRQQVNQSKRNCRCSTR